MHVPLWIVLRCVHRGSLVLRNVDLPKSTSTAVRFTRGALCRVPPRTNPFLYRSDPRRSVGRRFDFAGVICVAFHFVLDRPRLRSLPLFCASVFVAGVLRHCLRFGFASQGGTKATSIFHFYRDPRLAVRLEGVLEFGSVRTE